MRKSVQEKMTTAVLYWVAEAGMDVSGALGMTGVVMMVISGSVSSGVTGAGGVGSSGVGSSGVGSSMTGAGV